jgi:hypothetical protein
MTNNITVIDVEDFETKETIQHVIIDRGNGEYTSMLKSTYDAIQTESFTPPA